MGQATQLAALRQELRAAFPSSVPSWNPRGGWMRGGDSAGLSTGVAVLDQLLSSQGLPRGRITEVTGAPSSGRTSVLLSAAAATSRAGMPVAWIDPARAFFPPSAAAAGVVLERLLLIHPADLGGVFRAADILLRGQAFPLVVIDLASDPASEEHPSETGQAEGTALARLNGLCALSETSLVFLTSPKTSRDPLRYYASIRLETTREDSEPVRAPARAPGGPPILKALGGGEPQAEGAGRRPRVENDKPDVQPPRRPSLSLLPSISAHETSRVQGRSSQAPLPSEQADKKELSRKEAGDKHINRTQVGREPHSREPHSREQVEQEELSREESASARPRLAGLPMTLNPIWIRVQVLKNKLGPPGGHCEVALDGGEAHRLPLRSGFPDSSPSA